MPPLEAWERVLIDADVLTEDAHMNLPCTACHGGQNVQGMQAHEGLIVDPSESEDSLCATYCHDGVLQEAFTNSLHVTLAGYDTALHERSAPEHYAALEEMQANHCNQCHISCGQCHVSQPTSVDGGLLEGHAFVSRPPMSRTCAGCHGSRIRNEYTGRNEGYPSDVHLSSGRMNCTDCHTADEMHGIGVEGADRYDGARDPQCESCHPMPGSAAQHAIHGDTMACQVCHSISYNNCAGCHVQLSDEGIPYFETAGSWMDFRIARNPNPTEERPWDYVLVRHVPVSPTSFDYYGEDLLPNFDDRPTWLYTTPHNIQRVTPQNETCESCHGNAGIFLTVDAVSSDEMAANADVIVDEIPSLDLVGGAR